MFEREGDGAGGRGEGEIGTLAWGGTGKDMDGVGVHVVVEREME